MIKLSEHEISLRNLSITINALEELDTLIAIYSEDKPGPAYAAFNSIVGRDKLTVRFDRDVIVPALKAQREKLVSYLSGLGIEVDKQFTSI